MHQTGKGETFGWRGKILRVDLAATKIWDEALPQSYMTGKDDNRIGTTRGEKNPVELPGMLDEYYAYRGCSADGLPSRKRLLEIGLADVAGTLARHNKLSNAEHPAIEELLKDTGDIVE